MQYRKLGRTGVEVSAHCLGAMMFGAYGNPDHDECVRIVDRALEAGVNFVDTADAYSAGESEEIVGRALKGKRDDVVLATKCFNRMGKERNHQGGSRRWVMRACEDSLRRLDTDHIDLFQLHRLDWHTDLDDTLGALSDLVHQGKVRYIGTSSFPAEWIVEAQWASDRRFRERFVCEQPQYSILARSAEIAVLPTCLRHDIGVIPWSPLAGGWLTGKYRKGEQAPPDSRYGGGSVFSRRGMPPTDDPTFDRRHEIIEQLTSVAGQAGMSLTHMAMAFTLEHPAVTSTIIGPKTMTQAEDVLASADVVLTPDLLDAIDGIVAPGTDAEGIDHFTGNPALKTWARRRAPRIAAGR